MIVDDIHYCRNKIREQEERVAQIKARISDRERIIHGLKQNLADLRRAIAKQDQERELLINQLYNAIFVLKKQQEHMRRLKRDKKFLQNQNKTIGGQK